MSIQRTQEIREQLEEAVAQGASTAEMAGLAASLAASSSTIGECRIGGGGDWADLYPVLDEQGLRFCCTHAEQHSTTVIAPLAQ